MAREIITQVEFEVADKLMIADPCYIDTNDTLSDLARLGITLTNCAGTWVAEIEIKNEGRWGSRVSVLRAERKGARHAAFTSSLDREGENGVDSGQMYIGCLGNFPLDYDKLLERYQLPNGEWNNDLKFFAFGEGAVSSTGFGDGCYPVYVSRDISGAPVAVEVRFMEDEED